MMIGITLEHIHYSSKETVLIGLCLIYSIIIRKGCQGRKEEKLMNSKKFIKNQNKKEKLANWSVVRYKKVLTRAQKHWMWQCW